MEFWWTPISLGDWPRDSLPRFEQLSFFTRLHLTFASKVMAIWSFFALFFWKLQIYHYFLQCQDSSIKYSLNEVHTNLKLLSNQHIHAACERPGTMWATCGGAGNVRKGWWRRQLLAQAKERCTRKGTTFTMVERERGTRRELGAWRG